MKPRQPCLPASVWPAFQAAFPTGRYEDFDAQSFADESPLRRVAALVRHARSEALLHADRLPGPPQSVWVAFSLAESYAPLDWIGLSNTVQQGWHVVNDGRPFVIWHMQLSKVAPVYRCWFNAWNVLAADPSQRITLPKRAPNRRWQHSIDIVREALHRAGWFNLPLRQQYRRHPSITQVDWDHPDADIFNPMDDEALPRTAATLRQLCFGT